MRLRLLPFALAAVLVACADGSDEIPADERAALPPIAFESDRDGARGAYRLDLATGEAVRLGDPAEDEVPLAVSPDGSAVVLGRTVRDGDLALEQLVLVDGDSIRTLTPPTRRARNPAWSPDSRWITFESDLASTSDLFRIARDGATAERLTDNPEGNFEPHTAPGGAILFVSSRDMNAEAYRMEGDGSAQTRLPGSPRDDWAPRLSPDGSRLALLTRERGRDEILLARPDGLDRRRLADTRTDDLGEVLETQPAWSPDGRSLAYVTLSRDGARTVWVADVTTGAHRRLSDGWDPAWSPDGRYLALVRESPEPAPEAGHAGMGHTSASDLFLVRADGTGLTRLTAHPGTDTRPLWIPMR